MVFVIRKLQILFLVYITNLASNTATRVLHTRHTSNLVCCFLGRAGKFNSLEIASGNPTAVERDNTEFDAQRQAVISEAIQQHGAQRKTYGGIKQVGRACVC